MNERISVIIPALNEASLIARTLESAHAGADVELIVVDGGSVDRTVDIASSYGVLVLFSDSGRAGQMNFGARAAGGDVLLFLHADTSLPSGFDGRVRRILAEPGVAAGAFQLRIDAPSPGLRLVEWGVNLRSKRRQLPYGDQAVFMRKDIFNEVGGYSEIPILEDFELVRRLRRRGRIVIAPAFVVTSARRWQQLGILRTWLLNQLILLAYFVGISPSRLARWHQFKV